MTMPKTVRSLLEHLIDYAGLFPPAKLDMQTMVDNYSAYLASDDDWMLGRVIVPVARLDEFEACAAELLPKDEKSDPWRLSGLTAPAGDQQLEADLATLVTFNERHAESQHGRAIVDVVELRATDAVAIDDALDLIPDQMFPFFELPIDDDPRGLIAALVGCDAGAKVRTGGVTADLYPTAEHLARFITSCATSGVSFKATAGLHHPLHHHNDTVDADEFGFLNVFIAAVLASVNAADESELSQLLVAETLTEVTVGDDHIAWRDFSATNDQVQDARLEFAVSFGSCSFDDPRDDLRALELL